MKELGFLILATVVLLTVCSQKTENTNGQMINSVIGDISYIEKFGEKPDQSTDENIRIKTHLEFVEKLLRQKDIAHLPQELRVKRKTMLDQLHEYWMAGDFPANYDFQNQRKPCFIDRNGSICAVGYLVEQTAGRDMARQINSSFQYASIFDMTAPVLSEWVANSGLTLRECAMIQPAYGTPKPDNYIEPAYGISSSILSGVNISLMTLNGVQISKENHSNAVPILGLVSATGQLILGITNYPKELNTINGATTNEGKKVISFVNIGLGTSSLILSTYNLLSNRKPRKDKSISWNLYSYPTQDNNAGLGFTLRKQF